MRRLLAVLVVIVCACGVSVPLAAAGTVTLKRTFTLKSNATTTYALPGKATTLEDAGYVLSGPGFSVREDNLVDPFPHQPHNVGQITKGRAKVVAAGVKVQGFGFQVRVKTGQLNGTYKLTLFVKYA